MASPATLLSHLRAEEETVQRVKLEKENRELHARIQELQDDLDSEKESRQKVDKQRRLLKDELDHLQESLEESENLTAAQKEIQANRDKELSQMKKTLEEEVAAHESTIAAMRSKHNKTADDLNDQLEAARKVGEGGWAGDTFKLDFFPLVQNFPGEGQDTAVG